MTEHEWAALSELIDSWWPSDFDEADERAWLDVLRRFDREHVHGALTRALRASPRFRPALGEVVALLEPDTARASMPSWTEAQQILFAGRGVIRAWLVYGDVVALQRAEQAHPVLRAFCERAGLRRLALEPIDDPVFGGAVRKRLSDEWAEHVRICCDRIEAGRSLEAMGRRGELGQLDPLRAIQGGRLPELEAGAA